MVSIKDCEAKYQRKVEYEIGYRKQISAMPDDGINLKVRRR